MSGLQRQDLILFSDQSVISSQLCDGNSNDMILVTHTAATLPTWLVNALVETKVLGAPFSLKTDSTPSSNAQKSSRNDPLITIASFVHNADYFDKNLSKLKIGKNDYKMVDLFTDFVVNNIGKPKDKIISDILGSFLVDTGSTIVLEQPEILLSLIEGLTSDELSLWFITPLMKKCGLLIVVTSTELYFNNTPYESTQDKNILDHSRFTAACTYKSLAVLNLKPLETGRAKDVTGTLRITRGGAHDSHPNIHVVENEFLYLTQKDSTKLFYR
ncbi:hypothetical protein Kpol_1060p2 [Vanderwaltozyma polyspora DSM 70294]|uniref:Elongator complex protein 6 n=1 Tax=Vanderwaltozyma polyspora (strain ATCC 22028 / DSM 70294 / BCRC 21397 / CBS 2163 / NBRC 10782 / NRRL Y-8283 / UCD 57-17) TaxID=436907 RepID=A7TK04_VANPO|nr:uncharacterized protein Kpol_1060p2 [Vanderwaltozyma polyspora DSM 70294]EDO17350.1 hypothetical protein Kpol_1060p2 [Vanderwaltozyma polyspora DSM 70294]